MELMAEFERYDGTGLAELVRKGQVQPIELVEAAIQRIERWNPRINAVVTPIFEQARATAKGPLSDGPFTGVPFLLKDLGAGGTLGGVRMTMGTAFMRRFVPDHDSELVMRLKRSGLVILGKTNTPELGILPTTEPRHLGACRNPWNLNRTTGGSSGGSAAAVAAGFVPMAHANDGGGSIRIPASCCGLFGLKPTRARTPLGPDYGDLFTGLIQDHAVTRSVRDCAALLDATAGPDVGDPYWAPPPERPFLLEVGQSPGKLRIAYTTKAAGEVSIHADCEKAIQEAARLCVSLGHEVEEAAPDLPGQMIAQSFNVLWSAGCAFVIDGLSFVTGQTPNPDEFEPLTWALYSLGKKQEASAYLLALTLLQRFSREVGRFFRRYDILLTPTLSEPPLPLGSFDSPPDNPLQGLRTAEKFLPFTPLSNITGQPAMSVPLYWNAEGLPIGVHFAGRFGDEATLFRLAAQLEEACPWNKKFPSLATK
ncbi:MAG: Amidase [Deltaproteobacteria bacterium]|nr:Amidase [Deltaproteobacteria bacterium]